jgi:K+-transporting ATPase c subunit
MVEPHVTLDPQRLNAVEEKLQGPLEDQLTSALQTAADRVQSDYHGESVEQVSVELLEQARSGLHPDIAAGFEPDPAELRRVAEAVVNEENPG